MKIDEVTLDVVKNYLRVDYDDDDALLSAIMPSALAYIEHYTGLSKSELYQLEDITIAYLIIIEDMYDNRSVNVGKANVNRTIFTILDMHSKNNLG